MEIVNYILFFIGFAGFILFGWHELKRAGEHKLLLAVVLSGITLCFLQVLLS